MDDKVKLSPTISYAINKKKGKKSSKKVEIIDQYGRRKVVSVLQMRD